MAVDTPQGLTSAEVADRVRRGLVNRTPSSQLREYGQIVARNVLTWFNAMVAPAAVFLFILESYQATIAVSGMAIINTVLGLLQEMRAKRHLDKLAILVETKARVIRDGKERPVRAGDVVLDDTVLLKAGEAVVADGGVLVSQFLEVDEALLTGESDPVRRNVGDKLLSGSICVAGQGAYRAERVGRDAFAQATALQARRYQFTASPLTRVINRIVQVLSWTALVLIIMYVLTYWPGDVPQDREREAVREFVEMTAATITSMVPQGMVLTATIALSLGAVLMSRKGAVVQRLSAVETMAAVNVICTDKTGTLTTNRLRLDQIVVLDPKLDEKEARAALSWFASASVDRDNKNLQALRQALGETKVELIDQIPFKSQNRYSVVRIRVQGTERLLVLGAPETLHDRVLDGQRQDGNGKDWEQEMQKLLHRGLRILLLAECDPYPLADLTELPHKPLKPIALVCLADELQPEAGKILRQLHEQGIDFKVVSGDNPETVQGTVSHLDLPMARDPVVTGEDLKRGDDVAKLICERSVFGRVTPEQKVLIIETLQKAGKTVAMIGDGVNDVLPIKKADLGIAMGSGSQAAKTVSGLVLQNNNFDLLPAVLEEGRTIVRNLRRSSKLFLVKNVYSLILILVYYFGWFGFYFPYVPQQVTLLNWAVIGIPALVIAVSRQRSTQATPPRFLREVSWFAIRTGVCFAVGGVVIQWLAHELEAGGEKLQRTMLLSTLILLGITALWRSLRDGEPASLKGDDWYRWMGLAALPVYLAAMYWPPATRFFELQPLGLVEWGLVSAVAAVTYLVTLLSDRLT